MKHTEGTLDAIRRRGAGPAVLEMSRYVSELHIKFGIAKAQVDIAEGYLVTAMNR